MLSSHILFPFAIVSMAVSAAAQSVPLDPFFRQPPASFTSQTLENAREKLGFEWLNADQSEANFIRSAYTIGGSLKIPEARITVGEKGLSKAIFLVYSRGDQGRISQGEFNKLIETGKTAVSKLLNSEAEDRGRDRSGAVATEGFTWTTENLTCVLESSSEKKGGFTPEFIRLVLTPVAGPSSLSDDMRAASRNVKGSLTENLVKKDNGDVYIDHFPMVDQGDKGYCVVASAERMFRYYQINVDQHELAQIAGSSASRGTNPTVMVQELKPLQNRLRFRIRDLIDPDTKDWLDLIENHNKLAKKDSKPLIPDPNVTRVLSLDNANGDILKTIRAKDPAAKRFERFITENVNKGVPVLWALFLGIFPEKGIPQNAGGHMRIIIGYNEKTSEILYTDSWGAGHELKRMPRDQAWAVTGGLYLMEPLSR